MNRCNVAGLVFAAMAMFVQPVAVRADSAKVDQSFVDPFDMGFSINDGVRFVGQTYTAGVTGWLRAVAVAVHGVTNERLRVAIYEVQNGVPTRLWTSVLLRSGSSSISEQIALRGAVPQIKGNSYAIVVDYPRAPPQGPDNFQGTWYGAQGNLYPAGETVVSTDGSSWMQESTGDLHFVTYVTPTRAR